MHPFRGQYKNKEMRCGMLVHETTIRKKPMGADVSINKSLSDPNQ